MKTHPLRRRTDRKTTERGLALGILLTLLCAGAFYATCAYLYHHHVVLPAATTSP